MNLYINNILLSFILILNLIQLNINYINCTLLPSVEKFGSLDL